MNLEEAYGLLNNIYVNFSKSAKGYYVYAIMFIPIDLNTILLPKEP